MASKKKAPATKTARAKKASRSTTKKSSKTTTKKSSTKKATRASRSSTSAAETLWQRIASTDHDDAKRAFATYLALFGDAPADVALIDRIVACFRSAERAKDSLAVQMTCSDGDDAELTFALPYLDTDELGLPESVVAALHVANGAGIDRPRGGGAFGYIGIRKKRFGGAGCWDPGAFSPEEIEGFAGALDFGQNWIVFDANHVNALGEPRLTFISHEGGDARAITKANAMTFGQVFLRTLSHHPLRVSELDAVYA